MQRTHQVETAPERMKIDDDVNSLRTYIFETYNEAKKKGTNEKSN